MTYMYVRTDLSFIETPQEQSLLIAFLSALYDPVYINQCYDLGFAAINSTIMELGLGGIGLLSTTGIDWTFETSTTQPLVGQGDFVISQKRRTSAELQRTDLMSKVNSTMHLMQGMQDQIFALESALQAASTPAPAPTPNMDRWEERIARVESDLFSDDNAKQLHAALALAAISFTLWGITILGFIVKFFCFRGGSMVEYSSGSGGV